MRPLPRAVRRALALGAALALLSLSSGAFRGSGGQLPTTIRDFVEPGTQPPAHFPDPIVLSQNCASCHGNYDLNVEPYRVWAATLMAQSTRDPIFQAALTVAEQDADTAGYLCLRCHAPAPWVEHSPFPTDGSAYDPATDLDGVTCNFCHRMVDPIVAPENPAEDAAILAALNIPIEHEVHNGQFVIDPVDRRRGPFDLGPSFPWHEFRVSPFHRESLLCATCHDVSNPILTRQPDGTYLLNPYQEQHPTFDKRDEFPIERTYGEWTQSVFAEAEIEMGGRFGGNKSAVATCQDCHMPDVSGTACMPGLGGEVRDDVPRHEFNGANSWVLRAVRSLFPDSETGLTTQTLLEAEARNVSMLQRSADLSAFLQGGDLVVRIVNQTGHKLPTGYGEGRRMWINVQFRDARGALIEERGHYDSATAQLTTGDTVVYEIVQGIDAAMSAETGKPQGPSFHFVLNNETLKDNRIPARGFTKAGYEAVQADVVGVTYVNETYWADETFDVPPTAASATVNLYHQTTTKEYIEFLRDENSSDTKGDLAYTLWEQFGKSTPVLMGTVDVSLDAPPCPEPIPYGLGKLHSAGGRAWLGYSGTPTPSGGFAIEITGALPNKFGQLFSGNAPRHLPFAGGTLLVTQPRRGAITVTDAAGAATIPVPPAAVAPGTSRVYQFWFRDPADPFALGLSDALYVEFCD